MGAATDDALIRMSESDQDGDLNDKPHYLRNLARGRAHKFYINGDIFFPARRIVYNPRHFKDFSHYLDFLTEKLDPRFGAIRKIHTPQHGHRVRNLVDLRDDKDYVVAGVEKFRHHSYDQITASERKRSPPFKYDADPVYHSRQYQSSGKIHKCETHSILIKVWANGGDLKGPRRVLLTPRVRPFTLPNILAHVNEMLKEDCVGTVEKLHFLNGIKVVDPDQISQNGEYVACRRNERFIKARYTEFGTKNISTSPRLERKRLAPLGLASNSSTNNSSPEHSNASTQNSVNGYARRRAAPRREEDQVFPAKPVKHTRSSDRVRTVDLDKDEGGVFKAKQNNRTTRGAREVQDTRHTRTELPVDQREAREVEEEKTDHRRQAPPPPPQQQQQQQQPRHRGGVQAKPNSRRPPAPAKDTQQQQQPQQQQQQQRNRDLEFKRNQSATKIQANYRGYKARRSLNQQTKDKKKEPQETDHSQSNYHGQRSLNASRDSQRASRRSPKEEPRRSPQVDARRSPNVASRDRQRRQQEEEEEQARAAAKIQAGYRGHQTRKNRQDQRDPTPERNTQPDRSKDEGQGRNRQETLNSMFEEDMAAAKIQAGYRGHQTRKRLREEKEAAEKIQAGYRGHSTRSQRSRGRNNNDDDLRLREEERAASKIQAGFRGYQTRKDMRGRKPAPASSRSPAREDSYDELARENAAATKIQSQYRGFRARKEYKQRRAR